MVGMLGCGCCGGIDCDCGNGNLGPFFEQFNTKPNWDYQLVNLTSSNVTIQNNQLHIRKPQAPGNVHKCSAFVLPASKFQKLDNGFGNDRFYDPCFKKFSVSVDYELEHPGKSAVVYPYSWREVYASLTVVAKETNLSRSTVKDRYASVGAYMKVYSNQPGDYATTVISASVGTYGGQTYGEYHAGGQNFYKGTFKLTCEFAGLRFNGTAKNWLWRFYYNNNQIYQFDAMGLLLFGLGDACNFDIILGASFFSNNFTEVWPSKLIWFDNLKVEHFRDL